MAQIVSVNKSGIRGVVKTSFDSGLLMENTGLEGDAHADGTHRQLSLLAIESYRKMESLGAGKLPLGSFAENVTTEGIVLHTLPVGTRLTLGPCLVEVTQIGKVCHKGCEIYKKVGSCVMPKEGIFVRILKGGIIRAGDNVGIAGQEEE